MDQEFTVEVTEFDNLRNEYMQHEAAGEDYIRMLEAQLMSEYQSYLDEDPAAAEDYLAAGKSLIKELSDWALSDRHKADKDFVAYTLRHLEEEVQSQHFIPQPDDQAWVYLAGEQYVCLHYGNEIDSARLVYTRDGVQECIVEAVKQLREKREAREAELQRTLKEMQQALMLSQNNTKPLDYKRLLRSFHCPMIGYKSTFLEETIRLVATGKKGTKGKGFDPTLNQRYQQFIEDLAIVTSPLVMAGDNKTVYFRFVLSIPKKGEITVSWDTFNCKNYLYGHTFSVGQDYMSDLRSWWATSCMLEMKRLK